MFIIVPWLWNFKLKLCFYLYIPPLRKKDVQFWVLSSLYSQKKALHTTCEQFREHRKQNKRNQIKTENFKVGGKKLQFAHVSTAHPYTADPRAGRTLKCVSNEFILSLSFFCVAHSWHMNMLSTPKAGKETVWEQSPTRWSFKYVIWIRWQRSCSFFSYLMKLGTWFPSAYSICAKKG